MRVWLSENVFDFARRLHPLISNLYSCLWLFLYYFGLVWISKNESVDGRLYGGSRLESQNTWWVYHIAW